MENNRPRGREKNVTGPGKTVQKRGQGLGTGPVGEAGGYRDRDQGQNQGRPSGTRSTGTEGGFGKKLIILLVALLLGGGGGLTALLGGQSGSQTPSPGQQQVSDSGNTGNTTGTGNTGNTTGTGSTGNTTGTGSGSTGLAGLLGGLGGGSVSDGWQREANIGRLNTSVASGSREKYTKMLGSGKDTVTIMVYMCGTDLESRNGMGTADIQEMLGARFGSNINLLIYTGGCKAWKNSEISRTTNQIWQVKDGKLVNLQKDLGSVSMTKPDTLSGYIKWCAKNYPASRYELILWDHGGGSVSGYGYDEKFASSGSMSLSGLDSALKNAGVKFDFIGFDACLMATVETALTMAQYADYLIASEETEPGVGWYYTDWLTAFGENTSMSTIQVGQNIVDSFVDTCARRCRGQLTTLSVTDLAELEHTLPDALTKFSDSTAGLIRDQQYQTVSNARNGAREFAQSSKIDQIDLVHLAQNLGTQEANALTNALLGAVKYNRTSSNMTNAYGLSIYFPYRKTSTVDRAVSTFEQIGMDKAYTKCIRQFADVAASGQAVAGGSDSPLPALLGMLGGGSGGSTGGISSLLEGILGGRSLDMENAEQYLEDHRFAEEALVWSKGEDGVPVMRLSEEQWGLVQALELNLFYDDGEGYIDLGLDNVYEFDSDGGLLGVNDATWLAVNGQPVAYYHTSTVDDGTNYTITGRVPVLHNGSRAELILVFTNDQPHGFVAGVQTVYKEGETDTVAKSMTGLESGDTLEFLCDYYSYSGVYQDSYLLGDPLTVTEEELTISDVTIEGSTRATYRFTDLYDKHYWTPVVPEGN
ncbi:MAG: peptidase C11 [Lachnospiraceae bacterium]|nr:peptidase C11 [Lachnospiraceae bacterium]